MPDIADPKAWDSFADDIMFMKGYERGQADGWNNALFLYGLGTFGATTVCNDADKELTFPIGRREAYLDLAPGETASIRQVEDRWWE